MTLHDKNMRLIKVGDLLMTPHFKGGKHRRQYYLYHVVCVRPEEGGIVAIPVSELATGRTDGGRVRQSCHEFFNRAEIVGCECLDGDFTMFDERKRVDQ